MSLRILFADDSMTAQNMGRKILTEAGYDVVAVSNGAAAVKKIAEQKPDIIILDVYMPGYNGLEVCEKVRASMDTLRTPVLLTVGKMEPYRAEDANRVRADGVIIKPFEASDLLAIVKKLEERITPKTVAIAEQTVLLERPPEFALPAEQVEAHPEPAQNMPQAVVDVPDHMATAAAFSDLLGTDPAHSFEPMAPPKYPPDLEMQVVAPIVEEPSPAVPEFSYTPPERANDGSTREPAREPVAESAAPVAETTPPVVEEIKLAPPGYAIEDTQPIPIYEEPESAPAVAAAVEVTETEPGPPARAGVAGDGMEEPQPISIETPEPQLQPHEAELLVAEPVEVPGFEALPKMAEPAEPVVASQPVSFAPATPAAEPESRGFVAAAAVAAPAPLVETAVEQGSSWTPPAATTPEAAASAEDDFEARVAAAMSIYDEPAEEKATGEPIIAEQPKQESLNGEAPLVAEPVPFPAIEAPASFEYNPPVTALEPEPVAVAGVAPEPQAIAITPAPEMQIEPQEPNSTVSGDNSQIAVQPPVAEPAPVVAEAVPAATAESIAHQVEAELPAAAAAVASATGSDTQVIARVVHRVMERMMPELIEEISRELKGKK